MNNEIILVLLACIGISFKPTTSVYDINVQMLDGSSVNLASFTGKKIIVTEFDPANYDKAQLQLLDSLQKANNEAVVIASPAEDFGNNVGIQFIKNITADQKLSFMITQPMFVSKLAGKNQHPLFKWLTDVNENTHFNYDADRPGQIFMISESGHLYALLYKEAVNTTINEAATQKMN